MNPLLQHSSLRSHAIRLLVALLTAAVMLAAVPAAASAETEVDCETQSLQGAVDGADLGDVLHVSNGPCSGDVVIDKDLTIRGNRATQLDADVSGSITVAASASVMLDNLNLSGSYGHRTVAAAGSVTLRDSEIYGGGLEVDDGAATLIDTVLQESVYEFNQGGGIYSCGKLHITGGWIGDNFAAEGAGIYVACGETTISGTRFGGNGALHGGAMFVAAAAAPTVTISDVELTYNEGYETGGAIHVAGGNVTVIDSTITDNTAEDGGGIYNVGGTVTVRDTLLEGNEATARPGPRIVQEGTETFSGPGPHLLENVHITTKQGPCVLVSGASDVTIRNVELGPCGTEGIFIQGQTYDVGIYDSYIHPESSAGSGIAIRIDHSSDIEVAGNVIAHGSSNLYAFVASNLDVTNNLLINPLGPYNNNKQIQVWGEPETPELNDPDLVNSFYVDIKHNVLINSADPFWGPSPDPGDAINIGYTIDADIEGNHIIGGHGFQACGIITDNATVHGALIRDNVLVGTAQCGIGIAGGAGIEVSGNSILNGHVNTPYPGGNVAMYANNFYAGETPVCDAITIEDNTATAVFRDGTFRDFDNPNVDSSGICKDASGSPVTRDSVAADNVLGKSAFKALDPPHRTRPVPHLPARLDETLVDSPWTAGPNRPNGNGGAVYNAIGQFHLVESTVANNKAGNSGGGVYNGWLGSVVADRTKIAGNTAMAGGAVANRGGDVTLRRSRVNADPALSRGLTGNRAMISGGAIHNWYGFVAIRAVDIVGNTARAGGGISNDVGGIVKVKRSKLLGNVASGGGGAIFTVGGTTIVRESAIEGNSADRGGGIHALLGTLEVHDASIAANSADAKGAGVALGSINQSDARGNLEVGPTARFLDADIDRNHGDGIHASAGTRLELRRTRIRANTGSGIVAEDPGAIVPFVEVEVRKSKIKQNGRHGLEIHGTLLVKNSTIAQNRRSGFTLRGPGKLRTTKIANNHAGGWIGCGRTVTDVVMDSVEIKGNEPNGGLYVDCGDVSIVDSSFVRNRDALEGGGALFIAATAPVAKDGAAVLWDPLDGNSAGTASGEPEYVAAQPGRGHALELLDGDYVKYTIPAWEPAADADPPDGTIDFWIRPRRYGMSLAVLQWNDAASPPAGGYIGNLSITDDGKLKWTSWTPGTASDPGEPPIGESTIPLDRWSHVAVTWGASGTDLFVDGARDAHVAGNHYPAFSGFDPFFYVYVNAWGEADLGAIDHFRVSNVTRSGAEIRTAARSTAVEVTDTTFHNNRAKGPEGRVAGGAILNHGQLSLDGVTISANTASGKGGGVHSTGALEVVNCTLSANETSRRGGGLAVSSTGAEPAPQTTLSHVTITGNNGAGTAGGLSATGGGRLDVFGSIVAGNASGGQPDVDVSGSVSMTSSRNIYGDCCDFTWSATDLTDVADPRLGRLKTNGGLTKTHALLEQSPAIDLIPAGKCRLALDQRNVIRPQAGRCDAGAFELE